MTCEVLIFDSELESPIHRAIVSENIAAHSVFTSPGTSTGRADVRSYSLVLS